MHIAVWVTNAILYTLLSLRFNLTLSLCHNLRLALVVLHGTCKKDSPAPQILLRLVKEAA